MLHGLRIGFLGVGVAASTLALCTGARADAYGLVGSFSLPGSLDVFDVEPDGRVLSLGADGVIRRQAAPGSSAFAPVGSIPAASISSFGPAFIRRNPSGSHLAIGDNGLANRVHIVASGSLSTASPSSTTPVSAPNFEAAWSDDSTLFVSGFGTASDLYRIDAATSITASTTRVVTNIGDGSGGVAIRSGRVYAAIGFDFTGALTGQTRSFALADLALSASPVNFATGALVSQLGTASTLDFDAGGRLIIGGGGSAAVLNLSTGASQSLAPVQPPGPFDFYSARFNASTGEILVRNFADTTVYRYAIPAPGAAGIFALSVMLPARRRRARHAA